MNIDKLSIRGKGTRTVRSYCAFTHLPTLESSLYPISSSSVRTKLTHILSKMPAQQDHDVVYDQISPNACVLLITCD